MWKWEADEQAKGVVVILHSAYENHRWYAWLIEKYRSAGFHVVMGDLPGHGEQAKFAKYHDDEFAEYVLYCKLLMQVASEYKLPLFVVGNGLGAVIAIQTIQKHKLICDGLVLASPWLHLKTPPGKLSNALTSFGALTASVKLTHSMTLNQLTSNEEVISELNEHLPLKNVVTVNWYKQYQQLVKTLLHPDFKMQKFPMLLFVGQEDEVIDTQIAKRWLLQQQLEELQFKMWPNSKHNAFFETHREQSFLYSFDFMNNIIRSKTE